VPLFVLDSKHPQGEVLHALSEAFALSWEKPEAGRLTYLDTFDWRLFRRDLTLTSVRKRGKASLCLWNQAGTEWHARVSRIPDFAENLPPSPLRERLMPVSGIRRLLPRAHLRWEARAAAILNEDQKTVARLRVRTGDASAPSSSKLQPVPPTLELLPLKGYQKEAQAVRSFLWRSFGLRPSRKGGMALALAVLGQDPGHDPSAPEILLQPELEGGVAARLIHEALLSSILENQGGLIQDLDSEYLHDFRVGIRRTRAALGQIRGVFPLKKVAHFSQEFRWLGGRTGPTRDMDVYLLKIPGYQASLPGGVKDQLEPLVRFLEHKKRVEHRSLTRTLATKRYLSLLEAWKTFLESPHPGEEDTPNAGRPIFQLACERIWKVYKRLLNGGMDAGEDAPAEALHRLRIECKRLRYLLGFFQSLFPPSQLRPLLRELKRLQETLGDFNDLHVQQLALSRFADEMLETRAGPPETLMAMGRLMGQLEAQQEIERGSFHRRFSEFAQAQNVRRFRRLFKPKRAPSKEAT